MSNSTGFWDDFSNPQSGKKKTLSKIINKKLEARSDPYQFRLYGDPKEYFKLFHNGKAVVIQDPKSPLVDRLGGKSPSAKYACVVIDREDGQVKIIEVPAKPLKCLVAWRKLKKRDPGGQDGCDWGIDVTGTGTEKRYEGVALDDSPLTEEEISKLAAANIDLEKLYRAYSDAEAEERLLGNKAPAGGPQKTAAPANSVGAQTTVSKDIPF